MSKYKCATCMVEKRSKRAYDRHVALCKFTHISAKERTQQIDFSEKIPTTSEIFQIMVKLCEENESLKNRIEILEKNSYINKKRSINDYLSMITGDIVPYSIWITQIVVSDENLKTLFSMNLIECLKSMLEDSIKKINEFNTPLRAFTPNPNTIYIFDNAKWRPILSEEFRYLVSILSHRVLRKYLDWKMENQYEINSSEKTQELDIQYMQKANGMGKTIDMRVSEIKKWIFSKIQKPLHNVEF